MRARWIVLAGIVLALPVALSWYASHSLVKPGEAGESTRGEQVHPMPVGQPSRPEAQVTPITTPLVRESVVAPTPVAPTLTLTGAIQQKLGNSVMGTDRHVPFSSMSVGNALANRRLNPDNKVLSIDEERDLMSLVARQNAEALATAREEGGLTKAALLGSLETGRFESFVTAIPSLSISESEARRQNETQGRAMMDQLKLRLGEPLVDWAYSVVGTVEPDGIGRNSIVWFTRQQAPEVFAARKAMSDQDDRHVQELKAFFLEIPKR